MAKISHTRQNKGGDGVFEKNCFCRNLLENPLKGNFHFLGFLVVLFGFCEGQRPNLPSHFAQKKVHTYYSTQKKGNKIFLFELQEKNKSLFT
jgi:hypothetical protein